MAHCSVLEAHQKPTDRPSRRIKRSGGQSLVRQMKAFWIIENVLLQMLAEGRAQATPELYANSTSKCLNTAPIRRAQASIPEELEPVIDKRLGVRFEDPCKMPNMPRFRRLNGYERMQQCEL